MSTLQPLLPQHALVGGKYRLGPVIGSGGVGTVYRATHLWTEREVAVKILDPSLPHFEALREAFLREARATVQLEHPNVVDVLDMGEDDAGTTYLVMELLEGPLLRDLLLEQGRLTPDDTLAILLPLIDALETAHELGIVHKDFKPDNVILSVDPFGVTTPKLLDFGVAQVLREARPRGSRVPNDVIVGTPQYMSPEQARDQRSLIGPPTDVWSVGVVWYECLTGRPPFDGETPLDILTAVCEAPIDFGEVPADHVPILREALRRSPADRTQSLSVLRSQLEEAGLAAAPSTLDPASISSRPPAHTRASYIRKTLRGVGAHGSTATRHPGAHVDSELLTLPSASHWKAALGGAALAVAVGLAAWWTVGGATETDSQLASPPPSEEQERPASEATSTPEPAMEESESALEKPEDMLAVPSTEEVVEAPEDAGSAEAAPAPTPAGSATKSSRPAPQRSIDRGRRARPSNRSYDKPPDLVTEW